MNIQKGSKVFVKEQNGSEIRSRAATVKEVVGRGAYVVFPNNITRMVMWSGLGLKEKGPWGKKVFEASNNGRPKKKRKSFKLESPSDQPLISKSKLSKLSPVQRMAAELTGEVLALDKGDGAYVKITPQLATQWLALSKDVNIRNLKTATVERYQRSMENGAWNHRTGVPIMFNRDGKLVNGQHRCWAIVMADKTLEMYVLFGVTEPELLYGVDNPDKRTHANVFGVPALYIAIINSIRKYATGNRDPRGLSNDEMQPFVNHYKPYIEWYRAIPSTPQGRRTTNTADIPSVLIRAYENGEDEKLLIAFLQHLRRDPITFSEEELPLSTARITMVDKLAQFLMTMHKSGGEAIKAERVAKVEWVLNRFLRNKPFQRVYSNQEKLWPCPLVQGIR